MNSKLYISVGRALFFAALIHSFPICICASDFSRVIDKISSERDPKRLIQLTAAALKKWTPEDGRDQLSIALNNMGSYLIMDGRPEDAVPFLNQALQMQPRDFPALVNRAKAFDMLYRYDQARADLLLAYQQKPHDPIVLVSLCVVSGDLERWKEAIPFCEEDFRTNPHLSQSLIYLAMAYAHTGRSHDALRMVSSQAPGQRDPLEGAFRVAQAYATLVSGQKEKGTQILDSLVRDYPDSRSYFQRGRMRAASGQHPGAIEDFNRALTLTPAYTPALVWRAWSREKSGDAAGASADRNAACERGWEGACSRKNKTNQRGPL